jgi:AcrR family transcriptional regulator
MKKPLTHEDQVASPEPVQQVSQENQPIIQRPVRRSPTAGPPRLSRRERRKIATREALIKAAQEVIAVKGVYLAVIEEITERADVAKGSFYQYFSNRDELLDVLLTRGLEELRMRIEATPPMGTAAACVHTLIGHHLDYFLHHADFLLFLHQIRGLITMNKDETPAVRDAYRRYLEFLAERLPANGVQSSGHGPTLEEGVCALLGLLTGFLSHYVLLAPLTTLLPHRTRIETALTVAWLAFWQRGEHA